MEENRPIFFSLYLLAFLLFCSGLTRFFFSYLIVFKHIWGIGINVPVLEECLCGPELKLQLVVLVAEVLVLGGEVQDLGKKYLTMNAAFLSDNKFLLYTSVNT